MTVTTVLQGGAMKLQSGDFPDEEPQHIKATGTGPHHMAKVRPRWRWSGSAYDYKLGNTTYTADPMIIEAGAAARVVNVPHRTDLEGIDVVLCQQKAMATTGDEPMPWVVERTSNSAAYELQPSQLQVTQQRPVDAPPMDVASIVDRTLASWAERTATEAETIRTSLQRFGSAMHDALQPRVENSAALREAWRATRRPSEPTTPNGP